MRRKEEAFRGEKGSIYIRDVSQRSVVSQRSFRHQLLGVVIYIIFKVESVAGKLPIWDRLGRQSGVDS
jgi:hypothetical protein